MRLTCEKVFDLSYQASQLLIALVHFLFGSVGFHQDILSIEFCLICLKFCLRHLRTNIVKKVPHSSPMPQSQTRTSETHHFGEFLHFLHGTDDFLFRLSSLHQNAAGCHNCAITPFSSTHGFPIRVYTAQTSTGQRPA